MIPQDDNFQYQLSGILARSCPDQQKTPLEFSNFQDLNINIDMTLFCQDTVRRSM